ncbi:hypothetical protein BGZ52_003450 [Haplosporangium bisporale]|nr:hypothetical protein BGZ52_003450 [Haplosporangium bisporale]
MGLYGACNLPWIDTVINNYADNIPQFSPQITPFLCCLTPGDCTINPVQGTCPLGYLDCTLGNSRWACALRPSAGQGPQCYAEGTLTHTRNLPCCPSNVVDFLKTQPCSGGFSTVTNSSICCTDNTNADSCKFEIGCPGSITTGQNPYYCKGGVTDSICTGYSGGANFEKCVTEIGLVSEVAPNCMSMTFPPSGCALGGSGPALPPGGLPSPSVSTLLPSATGTKPSPTPTGPIQLPTAAGGKNVVKKWLAVCLVAPALLQMVLL